MKSIIVIPTYWTGSKYNKKYSTSIYDHPTHIDGKSTLGRLLKSFNLLDLNKVDILILGTSTHKSIQKDVKLRLERIIKRNKLNTNVFLFSDYDLLKVKNILSKNNVSYVKDLLNLDGYSNIRNASFIIPHILGYDVIISVDDDELITKKNIKFLDVIFNSVKKGYKGIAGYYTSKDDPAVVVKKHPWSSIIDKSTLMKKQLELLRNSKKIFSPTYFALGGNLVITSELFTKIPFDPLVSRGEDMDYVMNARFFNKTVYFNKNLFIEHRPPHHSQPEWLTLRKEIIRFIYQSKKIFFQNKNLKKIHKIDVKNMGYYPGKYLEGDVYARFKKMNEVLLDFYSAKKNSIGIKESKENFELLSSLKKSKKDVLNFYLKFQQKWEILMKDISSLDNSLVKDFYSMLIK